jgi:hypothetical protein
MPVVEYQPEQHLYADVFAHRTEPCALMVTCSTTGISPGSLRCIASVGMSVRNGQSALLRLAGLAFIEDVSS